MAKKRREDNIYTEEDILGDGPDLIDVSDQTDIELEMHMGDREVDVYTEEGLEDELEHDELAPWEQGFMVGEITAGKIGECYTCGKQITEDMEDTHEQEINGKKSLFCSDRCLRHADD